MNLEQLPPEILEQILSENNQTLLQSRQLNSYTRQLTERNYLKTICRKPISNKELNSYLDQQPSIFAIFLDNVINGIPIDINKIIISNINDAKISNYLGYLYKKIDNNSYSKTVAILTFFNFNNELTCIFKIENYPNKVSILDAGLVNFNSNFNANNYDLITQYNIYKKRLSCIDIISDYKKIILTEFNTIKTKYSKITSIFLLLQIYSFVYMYASILNLPPVNSIDAVAFVIGNNGIIMDPQLLQNIVSIVNQRLKEIENYLNNLS